MGNRVKFAPGEWYHCYSRGVDKRTVFQDEADYKRFVSLLYLANSSQHIRRDSLSKDSSVYETTRPQVLVSIGAYALMPNHFHLLLYEKEEGGISAFMRKLGIAYAMYFNIKNKRVGNLFVKPFRSKHLADDRYLQYCVDYIHLNPAELYEPTWKQGAVSNIVKLKSDLMQYPHSSLFDFHVERGRPESVILDSEACSVFEKKPLEVVLDDAQSYYEENLKMLS